MAEREWGFSWIDEESVAFDPTVHKGQDIPIASVEFSEEEETDAIICSIGREAVDSGSYEGKSWAFLTWEHPDGTVIPMLRMKLDRHPLGQSAEGEQTLTFKALPSDWMARRDEGLAPLKVLPFFDKVLVPPDRRNDPVEILDGHMVFGHFDRVTGAYTTPHILGVGLPKRVFTAADIIGWDDGGGVEVSQSQTPLAGVRIVLTCEFLQRYGGLFDATNLVNAAFLKSIMATLTGEDFEGGFPTVGTTLSGGTEYTVVRSRLWQKSTPFGEPEKVGPVSGSAARHTYLDKPDAAPNRQMMLPVQYYDCEVVIGFSGEQKRVETATILIMNGGQDASDGEIRELTLKTEDVTLDEETVPFVGGENCLAGAVRRVGNVNWRNEYPHVTKPDFASDLFAVRGGMAVQQWTLLRDDASPLGASDRSSYLLTERGRQTVHAAILKGVRILALSQRCVELTFSVLLEDAADMSTAWMARIQVPEDEHPGLVPGGWAEGKVVAFDVSDTSVEGAAVATITIACCSGGGAAPEQGDFTVSHTDEPWDAVTHASYAAFQPQPLGAPGGAVFIQNEVADQLEYVQSNDYRHGVPGRDDATTNDAKTLLKQVPTGIVFAMNPIGNGGDMVNDITIEVSAWSGPKQIELPA